MRKRRADHVIVVMAGVDPAEPRGHALCQHCGERLIIELPCRVDVWLAANRAFIKCHADCLPKLKPNCNASDPDHTELGANVL